MGLVLGIVMFMSLVLIHELGHFINAKRSGVKVLEFGIGIPPKVCKLRKDKSGTEYTLNLLPLGGFVRLKGEDPKDEADFNAKDSFIKAKMGRKILILISGVGMNLILARVLFTAIFTMGTQPISVLPDNALSSHENSYLMPTVTFLKEQGFISGNLVSAPAKIDRVSSDLLGQKMGLMSGDTVVSINNEKVDIWNIGGVLKKYIDKDITLSFTRNNKKLSANAHCPADNCILGLTFPQGSLNLKPIKFPFAKAMWIGAKEIKAQTVLTFAALGTLGSDLLSLNGTRIKTSLNRLTGPAGAIKFGETLLNAGGRKLYLGFAGMISLALAIFNVLPIPALDGGRLLGVLIQGIGKLKPEKYFNIEGYINLVFFVALMALGVYILLKDLVHFRDIKIPFLG
ncbi:MAG: site-2 protease family protein [candidate division SR1 bacterium]|nr:site-2 protease family protein [candidate division SR1 bacterium]